MGELHFEMYAPILAQHQFFRRYSRNYPQVMRKFCHSGITCSLLFHGDSVFHIGEVPSEPKMFFVGSGQLEYRAMDGSVTPLGEGSLQPWISEAALWTDWEHVGDLTSASACKLFRVDAKTFQNIVGGFEMRGDFDPRDYAAKF